MEDFLNTKEVKKKNKFVLSNVYVVNLRTIFFLINFKIKSSKW